MEMSYYQQYEPIFGVWRITRQIGEGSFGKVFELERQDFGETYHAALKAITIPASQSELREIRSEGMDEESVRSYFGGLAEDLVKEFALMSRLKGNSHIVSYENHQVIQHRDGVGWDILIQMELLTPLNSYIQQKKSISRQEVIKLGIDLCKALELCQKHHIIHRDIKPENTFVSEYGDFKLGDFGTARTLERTASGLSVKGSYPYMAPEVYKGEPYGTTVDIYSLGLILYRLLNGNRTPFLPPAPAPITYADREQALAKRFSGTPLPPPLHAEGRLTEIVLKACAYDPRERYSDPLQMRQELEAILYNREEGPHIYPQGDEAPQPSIRSGEPYGETVALVSEEEPSPKKGTETVGVFGTTQEPAKEQTEALETDPAEALLRETAKETQRERGSETVGVFGTAQRPAEIPPQETVEEPEPVKPPQPVYVPPAPPKKKGKGPLIAVIGGVCLLLALCLGAGVILVPRLAGGMDSGKNSGGDEGRTYNAQGQLVDYKVNYDPSDESFDWREVYEYDANGTRVKTTSYYPDGSLSGIIEFNANGNRTKIIHHSYNDDGTLHSTEESEYYEDGNGIKESLGSYYKDDGTMDYSVKNEYNTDGTVMKKTRYQGDGTLDSYTTYEYDANGKRTKSSQYNADETLDSIMEYDENERIVKHSYYLADGTLNYYSAPEYDANGNYVKTTFYNPDGSLRYSH